MTPKKINETKKDELLAIVRSCSKLCQKITLTRKETSKTKKLFSLLEDCIEICEITESFLNRNAPNLKKILKLCAVICHRTSDDLLKILDTEFQDCSKVCKVCAHACALES